MAAGASMRSEHPQRLPRAVRRWFWVPLLCALTGALAAHEIAAQRAPQYDAFALLSLGDPSVIKDALGIPEGIPLENQLAAVPDQIHRRKTARRAARLLRPQLRMTPAGILAHTKAEIDSSRGLIVVAGRQSDPDDAARLANALARSYLLLERADLERIRSTRVELQRHVRRRLRKARTAPDEAIPIAAIQNRIDRLQLIEAARPRSVTLEQAAAAPGEPSGASPRIVALAGGTLGLLAGSILVGLLVMRDRRTLRPEALAERLSTKVIAEAPISPRLRERSRFDELDELEAAPFLGTIAWFRYGGSGVGRGSIAVASASPGRAGGDSAWYLAAAAASTGARTLLVEVADGPRRPTGEARAGAIDLSDPTSVARALEYARAIETERGVSADVVAVGASDVEVVDVEVVARLIAGLESSYEVVVIETPLPSRAAAAIPFLLAADRVLLAWRSHELDRGDVDYLESTLSRAGIAPSGIIARGHEED